MCDTLTMNSHLTLDKPAGWKLLQLPNQFLIDNLHRMERKLQSIFPIINYKMLIYLHAVKIRVPGAVRCTARTRKPPSQPEICAGNPAVDLNSQKLLFACLLILKIDFESLFGSSNFSF